VVGRAFECNYFLTRRIAGNLRRGLKRKKPPDCGKGIRTGVVAKRFGGQVLDTLAIENFISVRHTEWPQLAMALEQHVKDYGVDIMNAPRVETLILGDKAHEVKLASAPIKAKTVILATGARWREMDVPGEKEYKAKGGCSCPHCDGPLFKGSGGRRRQFWRLGGH
jgi:alkyl hydroperoxide reductase subunit F